MNNRYDSIPKYTITDAIRGSIQIRGFRTIDLVPQYSPMLYHTLADGELLDFLSFKYYDSERYWWQIADANPVLPIFPLDLPTGASLIIPRKV